MYPLLLAPNLLHAPTSACLFTRGAEQKHKLPGPGLLRQAARSVFFLALGLCHWLPMLRFANMQLAGPASGMTAYDVAGNAGILGAIALNLWTARSGPKVGLGMQLFCLLLIGCCSCMCIRDARSSVDNCSNQW